MLILASSSPRRKQLLTEVGLRFKIKVPHIVEQRRKGESPRSFVKRMAIEKANAISEKAYSKDIVLAADTIVVLGNEVLGKPKNFKDAVKSLKKISNKNHIVFTAFCLKSRHRTWVRVVETKVFIRPLTLNEIKAYVKTGEPMDKAGAYAAQGKGMALISRIEGSYTNVVGLPVTEVLLDLKAKFNHPLNGAK